jgi:hypothetical protein
MVKKHLKFLKVFLFIFFAKKILKNSMNNRLNELKDVQLVKLTQIAIRNKNGTGNTIVEPK